MASENCIELAGLPPLVHIRYIPIQGEAFLLVEKPPLVYVPNMYKGRQGEAGKARGGNSTYPIPSWRVSTSTTYMYI